MCGSKKEDYRQYELEKRKTQQENYNLMTMNLNKMVNNEAEDRVRDEYHASLPFHTETLFLVFVVLAMIGGIVGVVYLYVRFRQARSESSNARAAQRLNIETGGIGAPKHYISPLETEMPAMRTTRSYPDFRRSRRHSCGNFDCDRT